jgi:hypothetical protein
VQKFEFQKKRGFSELARSSKTEKATVYPVWEGYFGFWDIGSSGGIGRGPLSLAVFVSDGRSPLSYAAENWHLEVTKLLEDDIEVD